ncbi:MAG TPA: NADPH-dependent FMN reductase [Telluria sp.]|jgi:FMN reductase
MNVLLLGGSPSSPSTTWRLLQLVGEHLAALGHRTVALQVRELPAQALLRGDLDDPSIAAAAALVAEADAVVVGTPVYKAAYSGVLKSFLDLLPQDGLAGKLVLPLATGGSQSHMLALDYALRPVLASLAPRHILPSVYATSEQLPWRAEHGLLPVAAIATRIEAAIEELAHALQHAPARKPAAPRAASAAVLA